MHKPDKRVIAVVSTTEEILQKQRILRLVEAIRTGIPLLEVEIGGLHDKS